MNGSTMTFPDMTPRRLPNVRTLRNYEIIWFDESVDANSSENYRNSIEELHRVVGYVNIFNNLDKCINFVISREDAAFFVIISEEVGQTVVPVLHEISQVNVVYIYCKNSQYQEKWEQQLPKVKGVYTDMTSICRTLKRATRNYDRNSVSIGFVESTYTCTKENLNELDSSFMYTQILKEILLTINFEQKHIDEFLEYCKQTYAGKNATLDMINKIEQEYHHHPSIWWYTSPYSLYSMVNEALRTMEIDLIIKMGFFIRDLHVYIAGRHIEQYGKHPSSSSFSVYRGQGLSQRDFDQIERTQGGLISFNNFLSTTLNRDVALAFAESNQNNPSFIGVLFRITIDLSVSSSSFANINDDSYFNEEEEILFSTNSVFRIGQVTQIEGNSRPYQVDLVLTGDNDPQLYALTECIREETKGLTGWHRLGRLMITLGQYKKSKELYDILLEEATNEHEKSNIFNYLGRITDLQGKYTEAIDFYKKSLEIRQKMFPTNYSDLANSYNNISLVYNSMGEYPVALSYCEKALEMEQKVIPADDTSLAKSYNNIGLVYNSLGEYAKAIPYYEKDLEITRKFLPENHPDLATSYNNIGMVYHNIGDYSKALDYFEKAMEIFRKVLAPNHPYLATMYNNIGTVHSKMNEFSKALSFHKKALELRQRVLSRNHPDLAMSYTQIGSVYAKKGEYSEALLYYEEALDIKKKILPVGDRSLALFYKSIAKICNSLKEYSKALSYLQCALDIFQHSVPSNDPAIEAVKDDIEAIKTVND